MSTDEGNIGGQSAAADSADSQNGRPAGMESWNGRPEGIGRALPPLPPPPPPLRASGWFARGFLLVLGMVCANGIAGIAAGHDVQTNTMIYAALPEFYAILALVGALMA